ncbi:MAG TPA: STAS domain-containing protein [Gaiellaceae bacterium]
MAVVATHVGTAQIGADAFVVSVSGELDLSTVEPLEQELAAVMEQGGRRVIVDLTGVTFIDSVSLGALVGNAKRLRTNGGTCVLVADDPRILRIFEITGLGRVFGIERSLAEGVDRLVGRIARA